MDSKIAAFSTEDLDIEKFLGKWFVISSNFPLWKDPKKSDLSFYYKLLPYTHNKIKLLDTVSYLHRSKEKKIVGIDTQISPCRFVWRGKGVFRFFSSNWYVALLDTNYKWAVIYFSKTWLSPEGVDIITRSPEISSELLQEIKVLIEKDTYLKAKAKGLFPIEHTSYYST